MKKLVIVNRDSNSTQIGILIARAGIAILMLTHGVPKMMTLFAGGEIKFPAVMGLSSEISLALAVFAEVVCSIFILAGFATRYAVVPLIITMLVAAFVIHGGDPLSKQEASLQYLLAYVMLFFTGSGKYSIDNLLRTHKIVRVRKLHINGSNLVTS